MLYHRPWNPHPHSAICWGLHGQLIPNYLYHYRYYGLKYAYEEEFPQRLGCSIPHVYCPVRLKVVVVLIPADRVKFGIARFIHIVPIGPRTESICYIGISPIEYKRIATAHK